MKPKTTPPKKSVETIQIGESFKQAPSIPIILANFIARKTKSKKHSGDNESSHLQDFATVARFLVEQKTSFSTNDAISISGNLGTPCAALIPLIHEFVAELVRYKRCKIVIGAYEWPIYEII